jgi:hypothetical protein
LSTCFEQRTFFGLSLLQTAHSLIVIQSRNIAGVSPRLQLASVSPSFVPALSIWWILKSADHHRLGHRLDVGPRNVQLAFRPNRAFTCSIAFLIPNFNDTVHGLNAIHSLIKYFMHTTNSSTMNIFMVFALLRKGRPGSLVSV